MEIKDIISLVNAGFTRDEIMTLMGPTSDPPIVALEAAAEAPTPAAAEPAPAPVQEPVQAPVLDNTEVLSAIKELTKTIQKSAILRDDLKLVNPDTAEDVLGKIINPTGQK